MVKSDKLKSDWNIKVKRRILKTLLDAMLCHRGDPTMMRNGCLILCQFQIPADVIFDYRRLVIFNLKRNINKPKGLKVAKEVLMSMGSMVDRLDDR